MFAVPGWTLSADKLRAETVKLAPADQPAVAPPSATDAAPGDGPSKKRKRPGRGPKVTDDNVADLWERVIEKKKRQGKKAETAAAEQDSSEAKQPEAVQQPDAVQQPPAKKAKKGEKTAVSKESVEEKASAVAVAEPTKKAPKAQDKPAREAKERTATAPVSVKGAEEKPAAAKEQQQPQEKKGKKAQKGGDNKEKAVAKGPSVDQAGQSPAKKEQQQQQKQQKQQKQKQAKTAEVAAEAAQTSSALATTTKSTAPAPKLTPLQASMRAKLVSARFRHLNETLYTRPSKEALRLFAEAPDMFQAYHEGFRQQVAVWPSNPVDTFVEEVRRRAGKAVNGGKGGKKAPMFRRGNANATGLGDTLPRTRGTCHIVDVGCGDAQLAASLAPTADRLRVQVRSYDLHADPANRHVTAAADAANLPLPADTADIVVFCLALMGTNWLDFVEEAYRVLRWKGELWVAEIKSRFAGAAELRAGLKKRGAGAPVSHSVGYRRKTAGRGGLGGGGKNGKAGRNEKADEDDPEAVAAALAEVDGWDEAGGATTDVSSFVNALRRRGFVLDDTGAGSADADGSPAAAAKSPAVDLDNKMFVRMRFLKAAPAVVGKLAAPGTGDAARKKPKFLDSTNLSPEEAMEDPAFEAKILKPCVYKLR